MADLKGIPVSPLTGVLDARSSPDLMPANSLRMRKNFKTTDEGKLRRGTGWQKLLSTSNYNNTDFHDQLLTFTPGLTRQPITSLFVATSSRKVKTLFACTQGKIASLNALSGNWRILGSGYGSSQTVSASGVRFSVSQLGDYVIFTNDFDKPMYHLMETNPVDAEPELQTFDDLDTIGLTRASLTWVWKNVVFFANVEMDGERMAYRLIWSGYNNPTAFDPADVESITGSKDLYLNEEILGGAPMGNSFLIYTNKGIWEMSVAGGEQVFNFKRIYDGENNEGIGVLKYQNTLVALQDRHVYMAEDGIYSFNPYSGAPERVEWMHRASSLIYDNLNTSCTPHVAVHHGNELFISVATNNAEADCPDLTLCFNTKYNTAHLIDHGFTAFCSFQPFTGPTIRDFIIQNGICTLEGITSAGYGFENEGLPRPLPESTGDFTPQTIYTSSPLDIGDGTLVENYDSVSSDSDSLCALLGGLQEDEICNQCDARTVLVGASSADWCLKEFGDYFFRERCVNTSATGTTDSNGYTSSVGSYVLDGYDSVMVFQPMYNRAVNDPLIQLDAFHVGMLPAVQTVPNKIGLRIGISSVPEDPNQADAPIVWHQHSLKDMTRTSNRTPAAHLARNTIPTEPFHWNVYRVGRVLYSEIKITGTGGDVTLSFIRADVASVEANNY
jgi:hypothetical protein